MEGGFEASSSFHVKYGSMGKVQFLFFKMLLLVLKKLSFWAENWAQSYNSMKLWDFPDIFWSLKLFRNSCGNSYIPCALLIIRPCFTWGKENFVKHQKVSKYYDHDCRFWISIDKRWFKIIYSFYKILKTKTPDYLSSIIPKTIYIALLVMQIKFLSYMTFMFFQKLLL